MKEINKKIFAVPVIVLCSLLLSCSTEKVGSFNNTSSYYSIKEKPQNENTGISDIHCPENIEASMEKIPDLIPQREKEIVLIPKPVRKASRIPRSGAGIPIEEKKNIISEPVKKISKEDKKEIRRVFKEHSSHKTNVIGKLLLVIFAIVLPPLAVALVDGLSGPFWLDLLLTILFYLPGIIYALYRVLRTG
jgi:uncharacterized membrane protein YqaE (UPF0057 family)